MLNIFYGDYATIDPLSNLTLGGTIVAEAGMVCGQIRDSIRKMIISYAFADGEELPPVYQMASRLAVNPRIVQNACEELQREGYLCSGETGTFYAVSHEEVARLHRCELFRAFDAAVAGLSGMAVGTEEMKRRVADLTEEK